MFDVAHHVFRGKDLNVSSSLLFYKLSRRNFVFLRFFIFLEVYMTTTQMQQMNEFMFNKKENVIAFPSVPDFASQQEQAKVIAGLLHNLHSVGYDIPREDIPKLLNMSSQGLKECVMEPLLDAARKSKGAHVEHNILFKDFPDSVRTLDIETLSDIRFASYFTTVYDILTQRDAIRNGITRSFVDSAIDKEMQNKAANKVENTHEDIHNTRMIHIVDESEYYNMVRNMLSARASLSEYDRNIVNWTINNVDDPKLYMPDKIQFNENLALVNMYNFYCGKLAQVSIKNADDFERLLACMSGGDIALLEKQKYRNFTNQERKALLTVFNDAVRNNRKSMMESFSTRRGQRFKSNVLDKHLHFSSMPHGQEYKQFCHETQSYTRDMTKYQQQVTARDYQGALETLAKHSPTLMIQNARSLLNKAEKEAEFGSNPKYNWSYISQMIDTIGKYTPFVDTKTLLSLEKEAERTPDPYRIMVAKGSRPKVIIKPRDTDTLSNLSQRKLHVAIEKGIKAQFSTMESWSGKKVYIDSALKDCPIPTVGRNDTGKHRTVQLGTKLPVQECDILRAALYKKRAKEDFIDFSAAFLDENYNMVSQVSWNNLQSSNNGEIVSYHSGDTSSCRNGCTEVIDIDINAMAKQFPNARYVAYEALMWDDSAINTCDEIFMTLSPTNVMGKDEAGNNITRDNVFEPKNVQVKVDLVGQTPANLGLIYDIQEHKAIVVNIENSRNIWSTMTQSSCKRHFELPDGCEALEKYHSDIARVCFAYEHMDGPTIKDLAERHARYRGAELVNDPALADIVFATDRIEVEDKRPVQENVQLSKQKIISPFDKDVIAAEYIPEPLKAIPLERNERDMVQHIMEMADVLDRGL